MWEKKVAGSGCLHCVNDAADCAYTFEAANSTAPGSFLNLINTEGGTGLGGHNDWRIPNVRELQSIVDYGPAPFFPGSTLGPNYWSSTAYAFNSVEAYRVLFSDGSCSAPLGPSQVRERAVRGPQ